MGEPSYVPTLEEIAAGCRAIRKTWSPEERRKRVVGAIDCVAYEVPTVSARTFYATGDEGE
jgi:hypothetical protein